MRNITDVKLFERLQITSKRFEDDTATQKQGPSKHQFAIVATLLESDNCMKTARLYKMSQVKKKSSDRKYCVKTFDRQ